MLIGTIQFRARRSYYIEYESIKLTGIKGHYYNRTGYCAYLCNSISRGINSVDRLFCVSLDQEKIYLKVELDATPHDGAIESSLAQAVFWIFEIFNFVPVVLFAIGVKSELVSLSGCGVLYC